MPKFADSAAMSVGRNVVAQIKGNHLLLDIDLSKDGVASKSGKNTILGTTGGNQKINGVTVGLNAYV